MTVASKPITAEELYAMGDIGRCELLQGEIVQMTPAGAEHGSIAGELARRIANFVVENRLGKVYAAETGFVIARNPDTIRAPDVAFVRAERIPKPQKQGFFEGAPDLAVEVVSPSDARSDLTAKVEAWLGAGTVSVWVVDPPNRIIEIYRAGKTGLRYRAADEITDEPTLPAFSLKVSEIFA